MRRRCPHEDIRFCPLYHAAHGGAEFNGAKGCVDTDAEPWACAVDQGRMDYVRAAGAMRARVPGYIEQLEWTHEAEQSAEQRKRNMRAAGIQ